MQPDHRWIVVALALGAALGVLVFFEMLNRWLSRRAAWFQTVVTVAIVGLGATKLAGSPRWRQWLMAALLAVAAGVLALARYRRSVPSSRVVLNEHGFVDSTRRPNGESNAPGS
jgi:membrane protein YdbS with pleckstrin-like domain